MRWIHVARVAALLLVPFAGEAAELSQDQQKCVNTMNTQLRKVGSAVGTKISACLRDYGKGRNGVADIAGCVSEDRTGKLRKASAKTATLEVEKCGGDDDRGVPRTPGVFFTDADTVNREAAEKPLALLDAVFGSDIEGAAFTEEENQAAARCQAAVVKRLRKCGETRVKEFNECKRAALQAGEDPFPEGARTEDELASCLLNDARGRIAKACDLGQAGDKGADKIRKVLDRKCVRKGMDLSLAFPTCGSQDAEVVHGCLETPVECLSCRAISSADALGVDCDLLDNGLPDGSCPTWEPVPKDRVAAECGLDLDLLSAADARIQRPYAVVRYGKLCHEFYPEGPAGVTSVTEIWSTTKTLGAVVTGMAAYQTRDLPRTGRKTGPLSDEDRVDHWLDDFTFNPEARVGHVLAMVAHNPSLDFGAKEHEYDAAGDVQVNRLSDIVNTAIAQDPLRLGRDLEEFTQRFLFEPLRMRHSTWSGGAPDKIYGYTWTATVRDMARLGLLILNGGVWEGERLVAEEWIYRMTHPAFEDANTGYGYLTWLASRSNWNFGGILGGTRINAPIDPCSPAALHSDYPHGLSASPDCNYLPPYTCDQDFDVGSWHALGMGGQFIAGHPGLDLLLVAKEMGDAAHPRNVWDAVRPALVALDPLFAGDEAAFCVAYGANAYAPDL